MSNCQVDLQDKIACIPQCWGNDLRLGETGNRLVVCQENNRFRRPPYYVAILHKCEVNGQEHFRVNWHFDLGAEKCDGWNVFDRNATRVRLSYWRYFLFGVFSNYEGVADINWNSRANWLLIGEGELPWLYVGVGNQKYWDVWEISGHLRSPWTYSNACSESSSSASTLRAAELSCLRCLASCGAVCRISPRWCFSWLWMGSRRYF